MVEEDIGEEVDLQLDIGYLRQSVGERFTSECIDFTKSNLLRDLNTTIDFFQFQNKHESLIDAVK